MASVLYDAQELKEKDLAEVLAGWAIATAFGVDVELCDQQGGRKPGGRNGECDLRFDVGPSTAVGEVVGTAIESLWLQRAQLARNDAYRHMPCGDLRRQWRVVLHRESRFSRKDLTTLLSTLEARGLTAVGPYDGWATTAMRQAGATGCSSVDAEPGQPGGFRAVSPATWGFGEDGQAVVDACDEFLTTALVADKVEKLGQAEAEQRHLAVVVYPQDWPHVHITLRDLVSCPPRDPALPAGVDALWVVPYAERSRALYWTPERSWSAVEVIDWTPVSYWWE